MPITQQTATKIALQAGDIHMLEAGRKEWSPEDVEAANAVYEQLKGIIQKSPENGQPGD